MCLLRVKALCVCKMNMHVSIFIVSKEIIRLRMRADEQVSVCHYSCVLTYSLLMKLQQDATVY